MRKSEKKVLAESNVQNIVRVSLGNSGKGYKSKENSDLKQKFQELVKENESLRKENEAFKRKSQAETDFQEKFHRLLLENNALEQELKNFKAELAELQRNTAKSQDFGEIQRKLEKSFAFLEENVVFFRNEAVKAREKLSEKEKELENLYINYLNSMQASEKLIKSSQKRGNLLAEGESLH